MKRREFLAFLAVVAALPLEASAQSRIPRIGFMGNSTAALEANLLDAFREGLRDLGYEEGRNIIIEYRWADGKYEQFPVLVAELIASKVDVIVTAGTPARLFGQRGDRVGLIARGADGLDSAADEIDASGRNRPPGHCRHGRLSQLEAAAGGRAGTRADRRLDHVGFTLSSRPLTEISPEEFRRVTEVTYLGFVHGTMVALWRMRPRDHGTSCRSAPRSRSGASRFSRPTAGPSTRSWASPPRCAASCSTTARTCASRSCRCRR